MNFTETLRSLAVSTYRLLPGRLLARQLGQLDRWYQSTRANRTVTVTRNGLSFDLDLRQLIDAAIYYDGVWEPVTATAFARLVKTGFTVIDVGANVGCHTLHLARLVGDSGRVIAVEPTSWAFRKLTRNLELNPSIRNVTPVQAALSDASELPAATSFRAQWMATQEPGPCEAYAGPCETLDALCARLSLARVHFIKLDVDGFETKVLRGGRSILGRDKPTLLVEMSDALQRKAGDSLECLLTELEGFGYEFFSEREGRAIHDVRQLAAGFSGEQSVNVVCLPTADLSE